MLLYASVHCVKHDYKTRFQTDDKERGNKRQWYNLELTVLLLGLIAQGTKRCSWGIPNWDKLLHSFESLHSNSAVAASCSCGVVDVTYHHCDLIVL